MQYLYARSKINSWIGNICHCLCNNPHTTANKKTVALSFSFSQCCHHTSPSILSSYSLIMAPSTLPPSLVFPSRSLPMTHPTSYFGQSPLLFPLLHRYKLSATVSPSTFVISWQCSFFQFQILNNLQTKNHPRVTLNLHLSKPSMGIMMQVVKVLTPPPPPPPYVSFVRRAVSLYSAAHFSRDDHDSWITKFLLIMACISQYCARASSPLSCNKDVTIFQSNMRNAVANFVGKTVRMVLPQIAYEALTRLIILKTILPSSRDTPIHSLISSRSAILPTPILICMEPWMNSNSFVSITLLTLVSWVATPPKTLNTSSISTTRSKMSTGLTRFVMAPKLVVIGSSGLHSLLPFPVLPHPLPGRHAAGPVCLHCHWVNQSPVAMGAMSLLNEDSDSESK